MAESSTTGANAPIQGRTSGRNKVKSQRAQDSEDTARMFAAVKARQKAEAEAIARGEVLPPAPTQEGTKAKTRSSVAKGKGKATKEEVFCLCRKPSEIQDGPMIECAECNDWFHFKCIKLSDEEAEKIHDYICENCRAATGKKTTMVYDVETYKSPSPLAGEVTSVKRKQPKTRAAEGKAGPSSTASDDDGEGSSTSSDSGSDAEQELLQRKPIKRQRSSRDNSRKPSIDIKPIRPATTSRKSNVVLPKARIFVLDKLAELVRGIFGDKMDEEGVSRYAKNVEDSLFEAFKDGNGPKAVAGGRYKTQFTLLDRSLPKARPELLDDIKSFKIDATKVALLNSADLATAERLEELERAKKTMLEQTVKQKDDQGAIRLGRDGFEQVEDFRERDMGVLAKQEQAARKEAARRESWNENENAGSPGIPVSPFGGGRRESASATPQLERVQSNSQSQPQSPVVKRESVDIRPTPTPVAVPVVKSPIKSNFGLTSAWGGADDSEAQSLSLSMGDQSTLDLSDLVQEPEVDISMNLVESPVKKEVLEDKPVVWSGGIVNPAVEGSRPVKMEARIAAKASFIPQWNTLLPHDPVAITGRVPVKASLVYLSESRLNPTRELLTVVFSPSGTEEDLRIWNELIDFHIAKDRHAIYHPHGMRSDRPVPNYAARELYLVPLRPTDKLPEFTDLLDDFSVPTTRTTSIFLGVFIGDKKQLQLPPPTSIPTHTPTPPAPAVALPNAKLQELMKSLNPAALAGVLGGSKSPIPPPPQQQAYQPYQPAGYSQQQYPQQPQGYYPPPNTGYNQYANQYPGHSPYQQQQYGHGQGGGGGTPDWQSMPPPQNRDNRDRDGQQGWDRRY